MQVKSSDKAAQKLVTTATQRQAEYVDGIQNPRRDWATATSAGEDNYKQGVTTAISQGRFGKGVKRAGSAKHQRAAIEKGAVRFGPGVAAGADAYKQGVEPYFNKLTATTLPPRYARRDPRNLQRVIVIATELGKLKEGSAK